MGVVRSVALALASLALSLVLAEGVLRIFAPQPASWLDIHRRIPELPFPVLQTHVERTIDTGESVWTIRTDALGLRVGEHGAGADPDAPMGLVLGDSYAFGQGVSYEDGFVARLEARLPSVRLRNAAVGGYGPVQYRMVLERLLEAGLEPAFLLVAIYPGNDFHDGLWNKDIPVEDGIAGSDRSLTSFLKRRLHLYRLLARVYHLIGIAPAAHGGRELYEPAAWERDPLVRAEGIFRSELARIAAIAAERAVPLLVLVIPPELGVDAAAGRPLPPSEGTPDYALPVARAGAALDALGIRWLDATAALEPLERAYFVYDGHLTPEGHDAVARVLVPEVRALR